MHQDQLSIDESLVRRLVTDQASRWKDLPLRPVRSDGTVNALYRLGQRHVVRLPLLAGGGSAEEAENCRRFAPLLTVAVPEPVFLGEPTACYPSAWAIYRWIDGTPATCDLTTVADTDRFAADLADVVRAVRALDPDGRTWSGQGRGGPMSSVDIHVRDALARSTDLADTTALAQVWEQALAARPPERQTWTHGDLMPGNLLVRDDTLTAVIDWGQCQVADPAVDLQPAWNLLPPRARERFRTAVGVDDDTWIRGRGWALAQAIGCLWYYRDTNPAMAHTAAHTLRMLVT